MDKLQEIREALSKITPGPWSPRVDAVRSGLRGGWICQMYDTKENGDIEEFENQEANAQFIANAPEYVASLLQVVEEQKQTMKNIHFKLKFAASHEIHETVIHCYTKLHFALESLGKE